ncbi:MAG: tRNA-specific adenosine deaminase [Candidatus Omnitrophica bacterium CG11_big_fil_rev_8_21_14_0_20_45_26]|uniref:tRNA-specific adenosine deaminase n=1 Tax=Candidatus Abzuiibacterium crystallinum TaxID=1974748 RepID=A0A2H0LNN5_9BACT|nr:MAG: tRNA-specific adenosine deaminase [Candidatus Omnitrophica bacterium CG11_big_fil_rev_8_21_14_0_20_45_26]PIW64744.1 MAG: tRNA-specific adenosine deaminase [Candidatus Omnitrophica bacterium CG12_big_fil_rev_8_21_14_0_65_45_16]
MNREAFMREALKEAKKAFQNGDVPVGAVAVYQNRIIARGYNQMELLHDPTAHAEMIAITQAASFLHTRGGKDHRGSLEKVSFYVTLEPCPMCAGALVLAHCENLIYGTKDPKMGACGSLYRITDDAKLNHQLNVFAGVLESDAKFLMQEFFKSLRKEKR